MSGDSESPNSLQGMELQMKSLREAHAHLASYGESLLIPSLASCGGVAECLEAVRREAASARAGAEHSRPFVRLSSARVESWREGRWPTLRELDGAAPDVPVVIMSFDHHAAAANSAALATAGLKAGTPVPPSGVVCVDASGGATGLLLEHAAYAAWGTAPPPTRTETKARVRSALASLAAMGFSEVHDLHSQPWLGPMLAELELEREGELGLEVWLYPPVAELESAVEGRRAWESRRVRLAGGKLFADGTLNSRTALMLHPYRDGLSGMERGKAMVSEAGLDGAVALAMKVGVGLAVHAIGDGAVRMVLDAFERGGLGRLARDRGEEGDGGGFRIEHCELIDRADVPRFVELGVVCSVQPCHLLADIEALRRYLPHRLDRVLPLRELIDSGLAEGGRGGLWFGSDVPIVRADPADSVLAATMRRREGMSQGEAIALEQRITEAEAWGAFGRYADRRERGGAGAST